MLTDPGLSNINEGIFLSDFFFNLANEVYKDIGEKINSSFSSSFLAVTYSVVIFNVLLTAIFLLWMHLRFVYSAILEKETEKIQKVYCDLITSYLFEEQNHEVIINRFRKFHLLGINHRKILSQQIIQLHKNLSGDSAVQLKELYLKLNLHTDSYKNIYSSDWQENIHGIRELTEMNITEAAREIGHLTHSEYEIVRIEAISALVELIKFNALNYFEHRKQPMSEWEQLMIMEKLKHLDRRDIPDFTKWLNAHNLSVKIFAVKLIHRFEQFQNIDQLIKLLDSPDEDIKKAVIEALGDLLVIQSVKKLLSIYDSSSRAIQLEIIKTFSKIGGTKELPFLQSLVVSDDYEVSLAASRAIKAINHTNLHEFRNAESKLAEKVKAIIEHALDDRI